MERYGDYILLSKIASGGMAEVFKAVKLGVDGFRRVCAVKRILPHISEEPAFREMFVKEAKLVAHLSHPNVVQIFDLGTEQGRYFLAMEYLKGRDLDTLVKKLARGGQGPSIEVILSIMKGVLDGLDYIHRMRDPDGKELHIVHRDVNPKNMIISFDGRLTLIDFGIARAATDGDKTRTGVIKGKLAYLSPEQLAGKTIDGRTDIFAAGLVLYELLTMRRMYAGQNETQVLKAAMETNVGDSVAAMDVAPALKEILARALAKDLENRYEHACRFGDDLEDYAVKNGIRTGQSLVREVVEKEFKEEIAREQDLDRVLMAELERFLNPSGESEAATRLIDADEGRTVVLPGPAPPAAQAAKKPERSETAEKPAQPLKPSKLPPWFNHKRAAVIGGAVLTLILVLLFALPGKRSSTLEEKNGDNTPAGAAPAVETKAGPTALQWSYLVVDADPPGQKVYVDGKLRGEAPSTFELPAGRYEVRFEKEGYLPWEVSLMVPEKETVELESVLAKK